MPKFPKAPPLADRENVKSELSSMDFKVTPKLDPKDAEAKVTLVNDNFRLSSEARYQHEGEWMTSLAFYEGNQWVEWKTVDGVTGLHDLRDRNAGYRDYTVVNKIAPKIMKLEALATQNEIDASVSPLTSMSRDIGAASEARAVLAHRDREDDWQSQQHEMVEGALVITSTYYKLYWDKFKAVPVPQIGPNGEIIDVVDAPVGDICTDVVLGTEIYLPPGVKKLSEAPWLIHAKVRPLSYVQKKYGRFDVDGETDEGSNATLETRIAGIVGEPSSPSVLGTKNTHAIVKEYWEKPSSVYPEGRFLVVASGKLLVDSPWPYHKRDSFPFVQLSYREGLYSAYGKNAVYPLVPLQRSYNRSICKIQEHVKSGDGKILAPRGCKIGPDAFKSGRRNEIIYYSYDPEAMVHGGKPEYFPPEPIDPMVIENLKIMASDIDDLTMHEVSEGNVPSGVTAASAINLLQESDARAIANFRNAIKTLSIERAKWIIALAAQFYTQPRLVFIQDTKVPPPPSPLPNLPPSPMGPGMPPPSMPPGLSGSHGPMPQGAPLPMGSGAQPSLSLPPAHGMGLPPGIGVQPPMPMPGGPRPGLPFAPTHGLPSSPALPAPPPMPDPQAGAVARALTFQHLANGRVVVSASSSTPKSPAAKTQEILDMAKQGLFDPQRLPVLKIMLPLMDIEGSDQLREEIEHLIMKFDANQPNPAILEQMKAQQAVQAQQAQQAHAQQAMQLQLHHEAELQAIKDHSATAMMQMKAKTEAQAMQLQLHHDAELQAIKDHNAEQFLKLQHQNALELLHAGRMGE